MTVYGILIFAWLSSYHDGRLETSIAFEMIGLD